MKRRVKTLAFYLVLLFVVILSLSCENTASKRYGDNIEFTTVWLNQELGEVSSRDPAFVAFREECENTAFVGEVDIDGEIVSEPKALQKAYREYRQNTINKIVSGRASYEIGMSAAQSQINSQYGLTNVSYTSSNNRRYKQAVAHFEAMPKPEFYSTIDAMYKNYENCLFQNEDWIRIRSEYRNKKTGELTAVEYDVKQAK